MERISMWESKQHITYFGDSLNEKIKYCKEVYTKASHQLITSMEKSVVVQS
jgi:RNA 3'-terminal phosphate cyclase